MIAGLRLLVARVLAMQPEQEHHAEDDRAEEYLYDAVVENLLVGVRGVGNVGFFECGCFPGNDRVGVGGCVLLSVDVHDSLYSRHKDFPGSRAQIYSRGVALFLRV